MRRMFLVVLAMIAPCGFLDGAQEGPVGGTFPLGGVSITLERTFCHGDCPIYSVTITGDGTIRYHGDRNVRVIGDATVRVEPADALELFVFG